MSPNAFIGEHAGMTKRNLQKNIEEILGISAEVKLVEPKTIQRTEGKAVRVKDNREI